MNLILAQLSRPGDDQSVEAWAPSTLGDQHGDVGLGEAFEPVKGSCRETPEDRPWRASQQGEP
jgi:hypothetical protein